LIAASDLLELIGAFKKRPRGHVLVPMVGAARGNPVVLDDMALRRVLDSDANLGCRDLIDRHPEIVHTHATTNKNFLTDIDTVEDLHALAKRTGWKFELPPAAAAG
jgi:CTP:molybdopterin cytidylyltransferase MocA